MAYRTIVAYLPDADSAPRTLKAAAVLARKSNAHLVGLYVKTGLRIYFAGSSYYDVGMLETMMEDHNARHEEQSAKIRDMVNEMAKAETFPCELHISETVKTDATEAVLAHARPADLIVCPNGAGDKQIDPEDADVPVRLMLEAGRPVLVVPAGWNGDTLGEDITLAYNGSREATRAAFDALPLLKEAKEVHAVWVDPTLARDEDLTRAADEIAVTLARHGGKIAAETEASGDNSIALAIIARARDNGSDMIVMGAYGHMRLREMIFGGTSREILNLLPLPALMSH